MDRKSENFGFRATPERARELRVIAAQRDTSVQAMLEAGLSLLLSSKCGELQPKGDCELNKDPYTVHIPGIGGLNGEETHRVRQLVDVLRGGQPDAVEGVQRNLDAFKLLTDYWNSDRDAAQTEATEQQQTHPRERTEGLEPSPGRKLKGVPPHRRSR